MSFAQASLLFLVQFAFGSLLTFAVADRRALGPKYFKLAGWVLVAGYGLAGSVAWSGARTPLGVAIAVAALAVLAFASLSGWDRPGLETAALVVALLAGGAAVALGALEPASGGRPAATSAAASDASPGAPGLTALALGSALLSSLVLGFTTWGMILGHWYLVSQGLAVSHLARLVRPLPWMLLAKAALSGLALWLLWDRVLGPGHASLSEVLQRSPDRVLDVVNVWARIPVGLLVPAVMACMTRVTVSMERTRPATGILYAMCVLVYMGELMGKMLEGGTGVPA
ncbi:MAG TPA: hypothetical protein VFD43_05990 [Planctomycetota bacterium]|nr:hypothetical protein [Planctomycetota bacterium]